MVKWDQVNGESLEGAGSRTHPRAGDTVSLFVVIVFGDFIFGEDFGVGFLDEFGVEDDGAALAFDFDDVVVAILAVVEGLVEIGEFLDGLAVDFFDDAPGITAEVGIDGGGKDTGEDDDFVAVFVVFFGNEVVEEIPDAEVIEAMSGEEVAIEGLEDES
jgi:hypothetical protein